TDIDECSSPDLNECSLHSRCENIFGSYMCRCDDGFKHYDYDAFTCVDIDECKEWGPCDQGCMNTLGSYECYCKTGFQLREDKRMCIDINECDTPVSGNPVCYGLCHNTIGSYMCHCPAGYNNTKDKRFC
ncbi:hypothetical protein HELRODRAFT_152399, partial [Helobdella robusta]|uniref:EGF-like domain-containing protein n=1 Tax=Helobdella robusta TaxID=6412 RepID=T1EKR5_HELRO